jgi:hypothetical protein
LSLRLVQRLRNGCSRREAFVSSTVRVLQPNSYLGVIVYALA